MPRDPQGAETRTEWRNGVWSQSAVNHRWHCVCTMWKGDAEAWGIYKSGCYDCYTKRPERVEVTVTPRYSLPPHAGEETKG